MIDWYLSLTLGIQVLIGVMAFLVGQIIIVFLFSLLQLLFVKWFRRSDE
ncbi:MAG: hypothetical protein GWP07_05710 [Xanthomonadaceae bacterium]|nr:hypothetical protein [Xanthomonadaceae bacterium]